MTTQRRLFALAAIAVMSGIVAAAACSFPEPDLVPDEGGTTTDGPGTDTDGPGTDAGADADPFADVIEPDAPPPTDATSEKPFVDATGCVCDCDKDGYRVASQDASGCDAGTSKNLFDCDDLDPRANPDASYLKELPTTDTRGDWNCDTITNREVKRVNLKCSDLTAGALGNCDNAQGFTGDPGCGVEGTYIVCQSKNLGTSCEESENKVEKQGCK